MRLLGMGWNSMDLHGMVSIILSRIEKEIS